eukprot:531753_1
MYQMKKKKKDIADTSNEIDDDKENNDIDIPEEYKQFKVCTNDVYDKTKYKKCINKSCNRLYPKSQKAKWMATSNGKKRLYCQISKKKISKFNSCRTCKKCKLWWSDECPTVVVLQSFCKLHTKKRKVFEDWYDGEFKFDSEFEYSAMQLRQKNVYRCASCTALIPKSQADEYVSKNKSKDRGYQSWCKKCIKLKLQCKTDGCEKQIVFSTRDGVTLWLNPEKGIKNTLYCRGCLSLRTGIILVVRRSKRRETYFERTVIVLFDGIFKPQYYIKVDEDNWYFLDWIQKDKKVFMFHVGFSENQHKAGWYKLEKQKNKIPSISQYYNPKKILFTDINWDEYKKSTCKRINEKQNESIFDQLHNCDTCGCNLGDVKSESVFGKLDLNFEYIINETEKKK